MLKGAIMKKTVYGVFGLVLLLAISCTPQENYKVLNEEKTGNSKYSIDLEILSEIEESEIEEIFSNIKSRNPGYNLYFVHFYLPGMTVGSGAWATANYNNGLDINIMGMSASAAENLSTRSFDDSIGVWKDNFMGSLIHLVNVDGNYFIRSEFEDGSHFDKAVTKNSGEVKVIVPDSSSGDFYIIIENYLEVWDNEGKIDRYDIIKSPDLNQIN